MSSSPASAKSHSASMDLPTQRSAAWKIFLRHPEHLAHAAAFSPAWPGDMASSMFLHADICRPGLLVEIEARFSA